MMTEKTGSEYYKLDEEEEQNLDEMISRYL